MAREAVEIRLLFAEGSQLPGRLVQSIGPKLDVPGAAKAGRPVFGRQLRKLRAGLAYLCTRHAEDLLHRGRFRKLDVCLAHRHALRLGCLSGKQAETSFHSGERGSCRDSRQPANQARVASIPWMRSCTKS